MTERKHYVVLAQRLTEEGDDLAEWIIGWTLDEARGFAKRFIRDGYTVFVREVGPMLAEFQVGVTA